MAAFSSSFDNNNEYLSRHIEIHHVHIVKENVLDPPTPQLGVFRRASANERGAAMGLEATHPTKRNRRLSGAAGREGKSRDLPKKQRGGNVGSWFKKKGGNFLQTVFLKKKHLFEKSWQTCPKSSLNNWIFPNSQKMKSKIPQPTTSEGDEVVATSASGSPSGGVPSDLGSSHKKKNFSEHMFSYVSCILNSIAISVNKPFIIFFASHFHS